MQRATKKRKMRLKICLRKYFYVVYAAVCHLRTHLKLWKVFKTSVFLFSENFNISAVTCDFRLLKP